MEKNRSNCKIVLNVFWNLNFYAKIATCNVQTGVKVLCQLNFLGKTACQCVQFWRENSNLTNCFNY